MYFHLYVYVHVDICYLTTYTRLKYPSRLDVVLMKYKKHHIHTYNTCIFKNKPPQGTYLNCHSNSYTPSQAYARHTHYTRSFKGRFVCWWATRKRKKAEQYRDEMVCRQCRFSFPALMQKPCKGIVITFGLRFWNTHVAIVTTTRPVDAKFVLSAQFHIPGHTHSYPTYLPATFVLDSLYICTVDARLSDPKNMDRGTYGSLLVFVLQFQTGLQ